ncbi:MFS transporter [Kurthia gibsonii]|uniref:MFS transporter n=1 Tax=Kurthia gibsonii TaxID=33946 RepID=A0ABU9LQ90_9BACL|nr:MULTISPECIES: MFS transporter [Kurthia]AMA64239.1 lacY proton/sugar symporter family protein [Kurthia sp. 11kri321]MEB6111500.1 MFS transporter [Kurthia gibsonii]
MSNSKRHFIFSLLFLGWIIDSLTLFGMNIAIIPISKELGLTETQSGMIISSFWLSSACMTLIAGWVSDKFGSRKVIVIALTIISLFSLLTGMVGSFASILIIRLVLGLGDGGLPTGSGVAITEIYKKGVRARAKSFLLAAQLGGSVLALYLTALISDVYGWRVMFYIIGGGGLLVTILLAIFYHPPQIQRELAQKAATPKLPLRELYKQKMLWIIVVMYFGSSIAQWGFSSWMPSYLESARHLNLQEVGSISMIPQAFGLASAMITGYLIDKQLAGKEKFIILFGAIMASACLIFMYNAQSIQAAVAFQCLYSLGGSAISMTVLSIPLKYVSERIVGSFMGTMYFVGGLAGFIAPTVMGALVDAFHTFEYAFFFLIGALLVTACCSLFFTLRSSNEVFEVQSKTTVQQS